MEKALDGKYELIPRHLRNPTNRFTGRAEWYHSSRPSVPASIIAAVLDGFDRSNCVIADFGAGTGLSAHAFAAVLEGAARVIAIEPNADMQAGAPKYPWVEWLTATAEETGLPSASIDIAISATAFHWFSPDRAPREIVRVLRPGGRLAVMCTDRNADDKVGNEFHRLMGEHETGINAANIRERYGHAFVPSLYTEPKLVVVENHQEYDLQRMLARERSSSHVSTDPTAQKSATDSLTEFWHRNVDSHGVVTIGYRTAVLIANQLATNAHSW